MLAGAAGARVFWAGVSREAARAGAADDFRTAVRLLVIGGLVLYLFAIAGLAIRVFLGASGLR